MVTESEDDSTSSGLYTNSLTLKVDSCIENGHGKHKKCIDEARDAESRGESSVFLGYIQEEILMRIFCKLPLHTLFQLQMVRTSWERIIFGCACFHNLWEWSNSQSWLLIELYDETSGSSRALIFYDVRRRLRYKKIFNEEMSWTNSLLKKFEFTN